MRFEAAAAACGTRWRPVPAPASAAEDAGVTRSAGKRSQTGVRVRGREDQGFPPPHSAPGVGAPGVGLARGRRPTGACRTVHADAPCRGALPTARGPRDVHRCLSEEDAGQAALPLSGTPGTLRRTVRLCLHPDPPHSPPSWSGRDVFLSPTAAIPVLEPAAPFALSDLPPDHFFSPGLRRDGADSTRTPVRPTASPGCPCSLVCPFGTRARRKQRAGPRQAFQPPLNTPRGPSRLGSAHQRGRGRAARRLRAAPAQEAGVPRRVRDDWAPGRTIPQ